MDENTKDVMFSAKSDLWTTPFDFFKKLDEEFHFICDAAAEDHNRLCYNYYGPDHHIPGLRDALHVDWWSNNPGPHWCNPPYSMCKEFAAKADMERRKGVTTVMLVPARTDTKWFHIHVWDRFNHRPWPGVEVRFLMGRLKFGDGKNSAPFPSMVVIFWGKIPTTIYEVNHNGPSITV